MLSRNLFFCAIIFLAVFSDTTAQGIGDMLGPFVPASSSLRNENSLKAPSARDIVIDSGDSSRSKAEIMQVVNARMPSLGNIYSKYLKLKKSDFSGKVTLKFTIAPGGDIISIYIISSTTEYSEFDSAVKNMIATWRWKQIKSGNTTVTIPFNFTQELGNPIDSSLDKYSIKTPSSKDISVVFGYMNSEDASSRSKEKIMHVLNYSTPDLKNIYSKYWKLKPDLNGKITLKFTIASGGNVSKISIVSSTTGYSKFDNDIKNMVATWKWEPIESGNTTNTTVTVPFDFPKKLPEIVIRKNIWKVINERDSELYSTYNKYLKLKPDIDGEIKLNLTIAPSGNISKISIESSTTEYPEFDNAIKNMVATWKWESINSDDTTLTIPFNFSRITDLLKSFEKPVDGSPDKNSIIALSSDNIDVVFQDMDSEDADSRSKAEIMHVLNSRTPDLMNIYSKYWKLKPNLNGKVTLKFTIAPGGDITSISVVSGTTKYPEFDNAIKNQVGTWKWKAIKSGNATVTVPFNFPSISNLLGQFVFVKPIGSATAPSARETVPFDFSQEIPESRTRGAIRKVINERDSELYNTYYKYLKLKPNFSGNITLKFTIAPGGNIINMSIVSSTTGYPEFDNVIKNMVATWKWEPIKSGYTTETI